MSLKHRNRKLDILAIRPAEMFLILVLHAVTYRYCLGYVQCRNNNPTP